MDQEEIIRFFTSPDCFIPATEGPSVNEQPGVYACYSDLSLLSKSSVPFPERAPWRLHERLLLYVGSVTKRPIGRRLRFHAGGGRADQSPFQSRLGCLIAIALGVRLVQGQRPNWFRFEPHPTLREWISEHVWFKVAVTDHAAEREQEVIQRLIPPLNVEYLLSNPTPFHLAVRDREVALRSSATGQTTG
jgi:hypothetical protein